MVKRRRIERVQDILFFGWCFVHSGICFFLKKNTQFPNTKLVTILNNNKFQFELKHSKWILVCFILVCFNRLRMCFFL